MNALRAAVLAPTLLLLTAGMALAQSCPTFTQGKILTAGQWQACFDSKQAALGYTPVNRAGDTMQGKLLMAASSTSAASTTLLPGVAPTSPVDGDMWTTTAGLFVRINGATVGPLTDSSAGSFAGTSPIGVTFPAGVVTYAFDFSVANSFLATQTFRAILAGTTNTYDVGTSATVAAFRTVYAGTSFVGPAGVFTTSVMIGAGSAITSSGPGGAMASGAFAAAGITALTGDVTATGPGSSAATIATNVVTYAKFQQVAASSLVGNATGSLANATGVTLGATLAFSGSALQTAAHTGDVTTSANSFATTLATAQPAVHTWALAQTFTVAPVFTDASGSRTALGLGALATLTPGTGVATALGNNVGSAGAVVLFNGAGGTPSSMTATNLSGTAASLTAGTVTTNANLTGDITSVGNATTMATTQAAVHTWSLAQTFTAAPVFTDASGSRTALGLGTIATQAASSVAITGGTIAGLTGLAIRDTSAAFDVTLAATSSATLSAGRTLTLNVGNVAHTLALGTTANTITFPNLASYTVITNGDTATVTLAMHATQAANTFVANVTSGTASPTAATLPSCTGAAAALQYTNGTGLSCATITASASAITIGSTTVGSGNDAYLLYNNAGTLGNRTIASVLTSGAGITVSGTTAATITNTMQVVVQTFCASGCTTTIAGGSTGTYTKTTGTVYATGECVGGGASGGGAAATTTTFMDGAGGGGSGSPAMARMTSAAIGSSQTVSIGTGGAAPGAGANTGNVGGDSSIGSLVVGKGGGGGGSAGNGAAGTAGAGGVAGTGDIKGTGQSGQPGTGGSTTGGLNGIGGAGGTPSWRYGGGGGAMVFSSSGVTSVGGTAATAFGSGGGGGSSYNGGGAANGGAGSAGACVVTEFVLP